jgi:hypothetical protein
MASLKRSYADRNGEVMRSLISLTAALNGLLDHEAARALTEPQPCRARPPAAVIQVSVTDPEQARMMSSTDHRA